MRINWNGLYREIYHNLTEEQKVSLKFSLYFLEQGIEILDELEELSTKYKFDTVEELETIIEKGGIKK